MAAIASSNLGKAERDQLAVTYAALILHDEGLQVTSENIKKVLAAAKIEVEAYWPVVFANSLKRLNISDLLLSSSGGSAVAASSSGSAPAAAAEAPKDEKKDEKKKEEEEEEAGGAMDLFGGGDDW